MMAKNNQDVSTILNHRDFKKVTGEEFNPEKMEIRKLKKGSANDYIRYDNEGLEYPPHETSYM